MLPVLTIPELTGVFLGVVVSLGTAFVYALWELERSAKGRLVRARIDKTKRGREPF